MAKPTNDCLDAMAADERPGLCRAVSPRGEWYCDEPKGHAGPHGVDLAHAMRHVHTWPNGVDDELTLRDRFAMAALGAGTTPAGSVRVWSHMQASRAYAIAESMLIIRTAVMRGESDGAAFAHGLDIADAIEWVDTHKADDPPHDAAFDGAGNWGYGPNDDAGEEPGTSEYLDAFDAAALDVARARCRQARDERDRLNAGGAS